MERGQDSGDEMMGGEGKKGGCEGAEGRGSGKR